jgi:DNA-binding beta-propeller fold protein YncE
MKQFKFICLIVSFTFMFSLLPNNIKQLTKADEKNPLTIEKIIGLSRIPGTFRKSHGLAVAKDGTIFIADTGESQIEVYDSNYKYLRSFGSIGSGDGKFQYIRQIALDQDENLYVLDSSHGVIQILTKEGKLIRKIGGKDNPLFKEFYPTYFVFLKTGELLVIQDDNHSKVLTKEGKILREFINDKKYQDEKWHPYRAVVDKDGFVYVVMTNFDMSDKGYMIGDQYFKFNPDGSFACEFIKKGEEEKDLANDNGFMTTEDNLFHISDGSLIKKYEIQKDPKEPLKYLENFIISSDDPANPFLIENPSAGLCSKKKLYIVDSSWNRLVVLSATKTVLGTIQSPILEQGKMYPKNKVPTDIFSNPQRITVGSDGNYYVANSYLNKVSIFNSNWKEISSIGKPPVNRNKELGELVNPIDMTFDGKGNLFVLETEDGDGSIEIFTKDGTPYYSISILMGYQGAIAFNSQGNLVVANEVSGLEIYDVSKLVEKKVTNIKTIPMEGFVLGDLLIDRDDNMVVSYCFSNEIQWISPKGKLIKKIGGTDAKENFLTLPQGMCLDGAGNIYVCEPFVGYIQKISPKGELIWTSDLGWPGLSFISMDAQGKLFATDTDHNVVLQISDSTAIPPVPFEPKPIQTKAAFSLNPSTNSILEGDPFTIQVEVKKLERCSSIALSIHYPEDLVTYQSSEIGNLFKSTVDFKLSASTAKPGTLELTLASEGKAEKGGSGNLVTITFQAKKPGTGKITIETIEMKNAADRAVLFGSKTDLDITIVSKDTTPPILKTKPLSEVVYEPLLVVLGETEPDVMLTVNQKEVAVKPDGSFEASVELKLGENTIQIMATDKAGNQTDQTLKVILKEKIVIQLVVGSKEIIIKGITGILDSEPFIDKTSGRTVVPLRAIAEAIGATVTFQAKEQRIDILKDALLIQLWIGKPKALVNSKEVDIDTQSPISPMIVKGRTFLPLRFIAETFEFKVDWDPKTQGITLTYPIG